MLGSIVVPFLSNLSINVGIILASSVLVHNKNMHSCLLVPLTPGRETYMSTGGILGHLRCQWDY